MDSSRILLTSDGLLGTDRPIFLYQHTENRIHVSSAEDRPA